MDFDSIEDIRAYFADDEFARKCLGATIDDYDFETGIATVSMEIDDRHHNAQGFVMGGVCFSLAEYARAVASKLKAVAHPDKLGRNLAFFTIDLFDEPGNLVARMSATVMRTNH